MYFLHTINLLARYVAGLKRTVFRFPHFSEYTSTFQGVLHKHQLHADIHAVTSLSYITTEESDALD